MPSAKASGREPSPGEQQQLAIGRALLSRPRLLLLDEPSLGLAPRVVDEVFRALEDLRREGMTILLVEQYAHRALAFADSVCVLSRGELVQAGPAAELLASGTLEDTYLGSRE
ncbi:MAG: ATP-binding cassette domain-containing protein [Thermoleophilia bacterium]|nr:ATP-binding cassette domain-containing protein [Thermoleophilia bacterium]